MSGYISAEEVGARLGQTGMTVEQLLLALIPQAQKYAIPPISNFFVGAAALGQSGSVYLGANFEFVGQALSFTVHAEQAAVTNAMAHGESGISTDRCRAECDEDQNGRIREPALHSPNRLPRRGRILVPGPRQSQ